MCSIVHSSEFVLNRCTGSIRVEIVRNKLTLSSIDEALLKAMSLTQDEADELEDFGTKDIKLLSSMDAQLELSVKQFKNGNPFSLYLILYDNSVLGFLSLGNASCTGYPVVELNTYKKKGSKDQCFNIIKIVVERLMLYLSNHKVNGHRFKGLEVVVKKDVAIQNVFKTLGFSFERKHSSSNCIFRLDNN
ncbi:MAG: hypothetical protein S4CHLAM20_13020 [Chlamydiia bacterium]|nr:hypothetical protein [Chlamydiia bacterium]